MPRTIPLALAFDDVLLVPQRTAVRSRKDVSLATRVTSQLALHLPIVSANTPWCTGAAMATEIARLGGLGIVHRMIVPAEQAAMVRAVKTAEVQPERSPHATVDSAGRLVVGAAIGIRADFLERAALLVEAEADLIVVDIAHGHSEFALRAIEQVRERFPAVRLVGGNVATARATRDLIAAGVDAVKVGIGPGGVCTTRVVTGCGVPQFTAVLECAEAAAAEGIPVIADGGIRTSGDIVKALAAGASAVMLGGLLAGCDESAAQLVERDGRQYKTTTGFVTLGVSLTLKRLAGEAISEADLDDYVAEGVEATFPFAGPLRKVIGTLAGGVRSGFSYAGATTLTQLWRNAEFIRVSPAGRAEGLAHVLARSEQVHPDFGRLFVKAGSATPRTRTRSRA